MKEHTLSPAAQAVLTAYEESNNCYREEWGQLAAALRAVIENCAYNDFGGEWVISPDDLEAIAAELEVAD